MILESLVFKTHGEARRYCEKYGIEVKGNTDVFMIAKGLARAFLEGEKVRTKVKAGVLRGEGFLERKLTEEN